MSWNPTHVVVAVQRAKDLISKGKNDTNDAFVTIALSDNKFQTSIKDKVIDPEWYEECDVPLPENYNEHKIVLQVCHRNNLGIDEFLGHLEIPLQTFDVYDPPRSVWYPLLCKPGQNKTKYRGEMEIRLSFEVKKVKDLDSMSTASAASKRFKMRRKIKGPKVEKTGDYIPDLTGDLDTGALDMDDIAENYAPVSVSKKKLSSSDSVSLPPASPAFQRNSPRSSKGYSPFSKRHSRDHDTPPSSNASTEDVRKRADDTDSFDGAFTKTHKRGGSGPDVKVNRRLLTARPKSSSTVDISTAATSELETPGERGSVVLEELAGKSRVRASTSVSQLSNEVLPELEEDSKDEEDKLGKGFSTGSSKMADAPVLIDDESDDSTGDYTPSPIVPLVKKSEPADLFARMDAEMKKEEADQFSLVKHQVEPGEEVFTPVGKINKPDTAAHSTPVADVTVAKSVTKSKSKGHKKKVSTPHTQLFDMLMASDEPEYAVDGTLERSANPFDADDVKVDQTSSASKPNKDSNPFDEPSRIDDSNPFDEPSKIEESNPFDEPSETRPESNPFDEPAQEESNPFSEPSISAKDSKPADDQVKPANDINPFDEQTSAKDANPFEEPSLTVDKAEVSNPFGEPQSEESSANPFEESELAADRSAARDEKTRAAPVNNPFEEDDSVASNPFEDDEDDESSFQRVGSFARAGSSRFAGNSRHKKREKKKSAAPPPPKPQRLPAASQATKSAAVNTSQQDPLNTAADNYNKSQSSLTASPKLKSKKEKKAPKAPVVEVRARSSSYNSASPHEADGVTKRRDTDIGRMEQVVYNIDSSSQIGTKMDGVPNTGLPAKNERQPAVGAEAPDMPPEPKVTEDKEVQVSMDTQEAVSSEFKFMSKQDMADIIQKLRVQVRKKDDHAKDLEEYIDSLLLRVMSADPNLLITQSSCSQQANQIGGRR